MKLKGRYKILVWLTKPNAQYHGINFLPQMTTMLLHGDYTTPALRQWNVCRWPSDLAESIYGLLPTIIFVGLVRDFKFHVLCIICLERFNRNLKQTRMATPTSGGKKKIIFLRNSYFYLSIFYRSISLLWLPCMFLFSLKLLWTPASSPERKDGR